jgi:L-seryl-tRNA(Ser) seleniumtransferase
MSRGSRSRSTCSGAAPVNRLKNIPKVDTVLRWPGIAEALTRHPRPLVLRALREELDALRESVLRGEEPSTDPQAVSAAILARIALLSSPSLRRVVNGTGIVVNTNLGRSPLPRSAETLLLEVAFGYSNLELDLSSGERGTRYSHVENLLLELTGAEAALAVNNNAAAVLLGLAALSSGRECIVSRGELVEIGGAFRIPDVMRQSGAVLREVGTTNRTHLRDYRDAIGPETGLLLKVHRSNFAVVGFTAEVAPAEMAELGRERGVPVMADLGSGSLVDLSRFGLPGEPTVREIVSAGVDVVTFSGDKLLGGPQAGLIVGKRELVEPLKRHPLLRALRIDKLTLAALEATLRVYCDEKRALREIPVLRMMTLPPEEARQRAGKALRRLRRRLAGLKFSLVEGLSQVGGGTFPLVEIPSPLIAVVSERLAPHQIEERLRTGRIPVVGRLSQGRFLLDPRTILDEDLPLLEEALSALLS